MSDRQKQILKTFKDVLPTMPPEAQSYLLGYGEGMAAAMKNNANKEDKVKEVKA